MKAGYKGLVLGTAFVAALGVATVAYGNGRQEPKPQTPVATATQNYFGIEQLINDMNKIIGKQVDEVDRLVKDGSYDSFERGIMDWVLSYKNDLNKILEYLQEKEYGLAGSRLDFMIQSLESIDQCSFSRPYTLDASKDLAEKAKKLQTQIYEKGLQEAMSEYEIIKTALENKKYKDVVNWLSKIRQFSEGLDCPLPPEYTEVKGVMMERFKPKK